MRHIILTALLLFTASAVESEPEPANIYVKVSAKVKGVGGSSSGSGGFTVPDNKFGRVTFAFYGDGKSWWCRASGAKVGPVLHLKYPDDHGGHTEGLFMVMDLYLKPRINEYQEIEVTGAMTQMTRANDDDPPLYEYDENKLEFILPNNGSAHVIRQEKHPWDEIKLVVTASSEEPLVHQRRIEQYVNLNSTYSLYNKDGDEFISKGGQCDLGMRVGGPASVASCVFRNTFGLDSGDSVMLLTTITIGGVEWHDDNTLSFTFDMTRSYALNPIEADTLTTPEGAFINLGERGLAADKMIIRDFHREITAQVGEKTEIEIPSDDDNMLPFDFTELIVLTNEVETKSY